MWSRAPARARRSGAFLAFSALFSVLALWLWVAREHGEEYMNLGGGGRRYGNEECGVEWVCKTQCHSSVSMGAQQFYKPIAGSIEIDIPAPSQRNETNGMTDNEMLGGSALQNVGRLGVYRYRSDIDFGPDAGLRVIAAQLPAKQSIESVFWSMRWCCDDVAMLTDWSQICMLRICVLDFAMLLRCSCNGHRFGPNSSNLCARADDGCDAYRFCLWWRLRGGKYVWTQSQGPLGRIYAVVSVPCTVILRAGV